MTHPLMHSEQKMVAIARLKRRHQTAVSWSEAFVHSPADLLGERLAALQHDRALPAPRQLVCGREPAHARADDDDHARNRSSSERNASGFSIGARCPTPGISSSDARSEAANEPARKSGRSYSPAATSTGKSNAGTRASSGSAASSASPYCSSNARRCIAITHARSRGGAHDSATATAATSRSPRCSAASSASHAANSSSDGSRPGGGVETSSSALTRDGATAATRNATAPPNEIPTSANRFGASASTSSHGACGPGCTAASPNPGRSGTIARNPGSGSTSDHIERSATPACSSTTGGPTPTWSYGNVTARDDTPPSSQSTARRPSLRRRRPRAGQASPAREAMRGSAPHR